MDAHLALDDILSLAEGGAGVSGEARSHAGTCPECRERLERSRAALAALPELVGEERPGCPSPEELAEIPPGGAFDDPHLASCPLCRAELEALAFLERRRLYGEAFAAGPPRRVGFLESTSRSHLVAGETAVEVRVEPGARAEARLGGVRVELTVGSEAIVVRVERTPREPLALVVENDVLEKTVRLEAGETTLSARGWLRARVERAGGPE